MSSQVEGGVPPSDREGIAVAGDGDRLAEGTRYVPDDSRGVLTYDVGDVDLRAATHVSFDVAADGSNTPQFSLQFVDADESLVSRVIPGRDNVDVCSVRFRVLPHSRVRCVFSLDLLDQTEYQLPRDGGRLKAFVGGTRVDSDAVDRITVRVESLDDGGWEQTPLRVHDRAPPSVSPAVDDTALLDEFGQWAPDDWPGKTHDEAALIDRLTAQRSTDPGAFKPQRSEWGGLPDARFDATGFFRTHHDGERWWLVDPDGHPFLSMGLNTVQPRHLTALDDLAAGLEWLPESDGDFADARYGYEGDAVVNYLRTNLRRAFGDKWRSAWADVVLPRLRARGFNTAGAWSDWEAASERGLPYTRCLEVSFDRTPELFKGLPDPFDDAIHEDAEAIAAPLAATADDPALVGYFLGDYDGWALDEKPPAAGMLERPGECPARDAFADALEEKYDTEGAFHRAWGADVGFEAIRGGERVSASSEAAHEDLVAFSGQLVGRVYRILGEACRDVDDTHLNLGVRYHGVPKRWALESVAHADVFSTYFYGRSVQERGDAYTRTETGYATISDHYDVPVLVTEWHHGALDVGLPYYGRYPAEGQAGRGAAYRHYFERALAEPWCVGSHYFQLYDQSAVGRPDGENGNIGLYDVCHRPYESLLDAAERSHERAYDVATGRAEPFEHDWPDESP